MLRVNIKRPSQRIIEDALAKKSQTIKQALSGLADEVSEFAKTYIETHTRRSPTTGRLAKAMGKSIRVDRDTWMIGIGDKAKLPEYWYVVNYGALFSGGRYTPNYGRAVGGSFMGSNIPTAGADGERFKRGGGFVMKAGKPITPMRYIEATKAFFRTRWAQRFSGV